MRRIISGKGYCQLLNLLKLKNLEFYNERQFFDVKMKIQKLVGLFVVVGMVWGAISIVGFDLFNDIHSILFVLGGATGYSLLKSSHKDWANNIGNGGVYFGWLGTLIGLIAIAGNRISVWGDIEKVGPALAVAMLPIFYGYLLKLITIAFKQ